jgi:hypothetical protein
MREMNGKERIEYLRERSVVVSKRIANALMRRVKRLAKRLAPASPGGSGTNGKSGQAEHVDINAIFAKRYFPGPDWVPPVIPCRIHLLRVPEQLYYRIKDPLCGWGLRTTKGVTAYHVNSRHNTLLREPYVREVAAKLEEAMANAAREFQSAHKKPAAAVTTAPS